MSDLTSTIQNSDSTLDASGSTIGPPDHLASAMPRLDPERYSELALLGAGGMGQVYRARDQLLHRMVALKFLHADDSARVHRMILEARAQARVDHENVCRIHEVGLVDGRPYISMQYIEGSTLQAALARMTLPQKLQAIIQVCAAVHEAHRKGLIHRDLKPANIMVEQLADGSFKPYVLDFGLSREMEDPSHTMAGGIVGTPRYMAPEQARGTASALDRRADVYSLGATLYEMFSGQTPFDGSSVADILSKLLSEEPVPLRKLAPALPQDLETITMKCLEREPQRRYDSAHALAEDLRRYLDGEPIAARRDDWMYRLRKKARKHKLLVALGSLFLLAAFSGVLFVARLRWAAAEQARLAAQLGEDVRSLENISRFAAMSPLHDRREEHELIRRGMERIRRQVQELGELAVAPGEAALGRGELALGNLEGARQHLARAWDTGYREPQVAYALGLILSEQYRDRLRELERIRDPAELARRRTRIEEELRAPALGFLREAGGGGASETGAFVQGMIALDEERVEDALLAAGQARKQAPWSYEAWKLEGDAYVLRGRKKTATDRLAALEDARLAGEAYHRAIDLARSEPTLYEADCRRWFWMLELERTLGHPVDTAFEGGLSSCGDALRANPESAEAYFNLSRLHFRRGTDRLNRGLDPTEDFDEAIRLARTAIKLHPNDAYWIEGLTSCLLSRAEWEFAQGRTVLGFVEEARAVLLHSLELDPDNYGSYSNLAIASILQGDEAARQFEDPRARLQESLGWIERAIQKSPRRSWLRDNQGLIYLNLAYAEMDRGLDPSGSLRLALGSYQHSSALSFQVPDNQAHQAIVYLLAAQYRWMRGQETRTLLDRARAKVAQALALNPDLALAHQALGEVERLEALQALREGRSAADAFGRSVTSLRKALRLNPADPKIQQSLAWTQVELAQGFALSPRKP